MPGPDEGPFGGDPTKARPVDDVVDGSRGSPVSFDVLENDPAAVVEIVDWTQPAQGSLTHHGDGSFTFTPDLYVMPGEEELDYRARMVDGAIRSATVHIRIDGGWGRAWPHGETTLRHSFARTLLAQGERYLLFIAEEPDGVYELRLDRFDPAARAWSTDRRLVASSQLRVLDVHVARDGTILLSYWKPSEIVGALRRTDGSWVSASLSPSTEAARAQFVESSAGAVTLLVSPQSGVNSSLWAANAGAEWSQPVRIDGVPNGHVSDFLATYATTGDLYVALRTSEPRGVMPIVSATRYDATTGSWDLPVLLQETWGNPYLRALDAAPDGSVILVWTLRDLTYPMCLLTNRAIDGEWSEAARLNDGTADLSGYLYGVRVRENGTMLVAWEDTDGVRSRSRSDSGEWGPVLSLATARPEESVTLSRFFATGPTTESLVFQKFGPDGSRLYVATDAADPASAHPLGLLRNDVATEMLGATMTPDGGILLAWNDGGGLRGAKARAQETVEWSLGGEASWVSLFPRPDGSALFVREEPAGRRSNLVAHLVSASRPKTPEAFVLDGNGGLDVAGVESADGRLWLLWQTGEESLRLRSAVVGADRVIAKAEDVFHDGEPAVSRGVIASWLNDDGLPALLVARQPLGGQGLSAPVVYETTDMRELGAAGTGPADHASTTVLVGR